MKVDSPGPCGNGFLFMHGFLTVDFFGGLQGPASQSLQLKIPAQLGLRIVNREEGLDRPWCTLHIMPTFSCDGHCSQTDYARRTTPPSSICSSVCVCCLNSVWLSPSSIVSPSSPQCGSYIRTCRMEGFNNSAQLEYRMAYTVQIIWYFQGLSQGKAYQVTLLMASDHIQCALQWVLESPATLNCLFFLSST